LVAEALGKYDTIGIDCVAMNVNDVICLGAEPIALVDYLALDRARPRLVADVARGLRKGAREAGVAIVSGETAVMPDLIKGFDLAASVVGIVRRDSIITGETARPGDVVLGLRSNGIHSNGLTLARKILFSRGFNRRIALELLRPTRIYVKPIIRLLRAGVKIHALAHITGGAYSKLKRIASRARVGLDLHSLPQPHPIFRTIQRKGRLSNREMLRTFNMGVGFLIICPPKQGLEVRRLLPEAGVVGEVNDSNSITASLHGKVVEIERI